MYYKIPITASCSSKVQSFFTFIYSQVPLMVVRYITDFNFSQIIFQVSLCLGKKN